MQKKKKGFTLVELLVVIAILAILAAVSVVGYLSFTEKAKESNDNTLVTQLNTVLQADEATDGKPKTMSDALDVLKENGFLVENLTPTSAKNEFLYNLKENRFEIKTQDEVKNLNNGDYWYIVEDETSLNDMKDNCSLYLIDGLSLTNTEILDIKHGFDSLNNSVTKLTVKNEDIASNIVLNTNAANIEINAADDNVSHYGTADNVTVTAVANNSYHEYGIVNRIEVASGHVSFENNCQINEIHISGDNVKVTISKDVVNPENVNIYVDPNVTIGEIIKPDNIKEPLKKELVTSIDSFIYPNFNDPAQNKCTDRYFVFSNDLNITNGERKYIEVNCRKKDTRKVIFDLNGNSLNLSRDDNSYQELIFIGNSKTYGIECEIKNGTINNKTYNAIKLTTANLVISNCNINCTKETNIINDNSRFITINTSNKTQTVEFNNCIFNGNILYDISSNFEFRNDVNVIINGGTYKCIKPAQNLINNKVNLCINSGDFFANADGDPNFIKGTIYNSGKIVINGGTFNCLSKAALYNEGQATLNGGRFISKSCSLCNKNEATGKTHYVYSVYSGGNNNTFITINEGTYIEGIHGGLAVTSGGAEINGGNIVTVECPTHKTTSHYALYLAGEVAETNIIIKGGEFTSFDKVAMYVGNSNDGGNKEHARVTVKGGTFNGGGDKTAIKVDSSLGYLNVLGGKYSSDISKVANLNVKTVQNGNYWVVA